MNRKDLLKQLRKPTKRVSILVPEFGENARVWFSPLTPADETKIQEMVTGFEPEPSEVAVYSAIGLLIQKLESENGEKLLSPGDLSLLLNIKSSVVSRIASEINLGEGDKFNKMVEDEKKHSEATESD